MMGSEKMVELQTYKNTKLCKGGGVYYLPCEHIENCNVCINYALDKRQGNNNELHRIFDMPYILCKRDFPNFKPISKEKFKELYYNDTEWTDTFEVAYKKAKDLGLVV